MKGRKPKVFAQIGRDKLKLAENKVKTFFKSSVKAFTSSGYIPISKEYQDHDVFVIVLEKKVNKNGK